MCSVVILFRPGHRWPLLLGANRDEMVSRPCRAPARHWADRPDVVAGFDELTQGSWMGVNDAGVAACVLNRVGTLGPAPGKRSRGELVLDALDHASAEEAVTALGELDPAAWRSFNLVVADEDRAFWLRGRDSAAERVEVFPIPEGLSLLTAHDLNDTSAPRIARFLPLLRAAPAPDPDRGDWRAWQALLATRDEREPAHGLCIQTDVGFATVSSGLLALPGRPRTLSEPPRRPLWLYAPGRPDVTPWTALDLG